MKVVEIGDYSAAGDDQTETTQAQLSEPELPMAATTTKSMSIEESYLLWLRRGSALAAPSAACVVEPVVQEPLRAGAAQQSPVAESVRKQQRVANIVAPMRLSHPRPHMLAQPVELEVDHASDEWVEVRAADGVHARGLPLPRVKVSIALLGTDAD